MNPNLIYVRKTYFSFLFSSFIFFSMLILIIGKNTSPLNITGTFKIVSVLLAFIPTGLFLYRWKKRKVDKKTFLKLCIIGYIPIAVGTFFSIFYKNYLYFVLLFPIFFLSYLVIVPTQNFIED